MFNEPSRIRDAQLAECADALLALRTCECDAENLRSQACSIANRTSAAAHVGSQSLARKFAVSCFVKVLHLRDDSLEGFLHRLTLAAFAPRDFDFAFTRAMQHSLLKCLGQIAPRNIGLCFECFAQRGQQARVVAFHARVRFRPWRDGSISEG